MQKYVELSNNDLTNERENDWFKTCQKNSIPFITLKKRTKFADVQWDYITYSSEVDRVLNAGNGQLRDGAIAIFKKYVNSTSDYEVSDLLVSFKNIEISKAKLAAEELYDFIVAYLKRSGVVHHA